MIDIQGSTSFTIVIYIFFSLYSYHLSYDDNSLFNVKKKSIITFNRNSCAVSCVAYILEEEDKFTDLPDLDSRSKKKMEKLFEKFIYLYTNVTIRIYIVIYVF